MWIRGLPVPKLIGDITHADMNGRHQNININHATFAPDASIHFYPTKKASDLIEVRRCHDFAHGLGGGGEEGWQRERGRRRQREGERENANER